MAPRLYTRLLARIVSGTIGTFYFGPPPAGYVWDVRNIDAYCTPFTRDRIGELWIGDDVGAAILALPSGTPIPGRTYHWDGRQLIGPAERIQVRMGSNEWSIRITGYELLNP
ncbi:MAG: hypothetical protein JO244_10780 [Solirubrobacterales bacterium]|nr:hypothetical protein [Solirubrobacterales bacterium]